MPLTIGRRPDHGFDEPLGLLSDCHRRIEHFLDVFIAVVERTHGGMLSRTERADLDAALTYFASAAPRHTEDEEQSLFPRLRESADPAAREALETVARLERDHDEAAAHHEAADRLARRWLADGTLDGAATQELHDRLGALRDIYTAHIKVEDRDLFPTAERLLSPEAIQEIGREMAARRSQAPKK